MTSAVYFLAMPFVHWLISFHWIAIVTSVSLSNLLISEKHLVLSFKTQAMLYKYIK